LLQLFLAAMRCLLQRAIVLQYFHLNYDDVLDSVPCELAWRLKRSLLDVSSFIVPVSQSAYEDIKNLRTEAHGRFVSASYPGVYKQSVEMTQASDAQRRKLDLN
jgi:hypothetical protein